MPPLLAWMVTNLRAVIFDMDGILIDTEPVWRQVEIEIFGRLGLHLTEEQCLQTMGVRTPDVVRYWYSRHPWTGAPLDAVAGEIEDEVVRRVLSIGAPKPCVHEALRTVHEAGLQTAIASSSSEVLIAAVVQRLGLGSSISVTCSGYNEPRGKPDPGVYLTAAQKLDVPPAACLAIEDSPNGVLSAKAAGMICIAIPDPNLAEDPRFEQADLHLASLCELTPHVLHEVDSIHVP